MEACRWPARHRVFTRPNDAMICFNNEQTNNHNMNTPNLVFDYLENGKGLGVCGDEASLVECSASLGQSQPSGRTRTCGIEGGKIPDHIVYYEPTTRTWRCYGERLQIGRMGTWSVYLFRPQVLQRNFTCQRDTQQSWMEMPSRYYTMQTSSGEQTADSFLEGISISQMKQWRFCSQEMRYAFGRPVRCQPENFSISSLVFSVIAGFREAVSPRLCINM